MSIVSSSPISNEPRVRAAIAQAAASTGVDFNYLYNQARIESGLNPDARARTSSASGLFQFTRQTWLRTVKAHGAEHGADWAARAIEKSGSGLIVADPALRGAIDRLRNDPDFAAAMAGELAADNRTQIETQLGRPAEPVDLYLAHFLGSAGAVNFLSAHDADPDMAAAPLFPAAAAANRAVFYGPGGEPRSLSEIRKGFAARINVAADSVTIALSANAAPWTMTRHAIAEATDRAPMQVAAIEAVPSKLSLEFAARAYQRLAGLGA